MVNHYLAGAGREDSVNHRVSDKTPEWTTEKKGSSLHKALNYSYWDFSSFFSPFYFLFWAIKQVIPPRPSFKWLAFPF